VIAMEIEQGVDEYVNESWYKRPCAWQSMTKGWAIGGIIFVYSIVKTQMLLKSANRAVLGNIITTGLIFWPVCQYNTRVTERAQQAQQERLRSTKNSREELETILLGQDEEFGKKIKDILEIKDDERSKEEQSY